MPAGGVRLEHDGSLAVVTIDRPEARNAIARATMRELEAALDEVAASDAHVLVVTGGGDRVFVAGGDLKELAEIRTVEAATEMAEHMRTVLDRLATLPVPVVAAVNGDAYGGGAEVMVACDIRVAADDVKCGFNQVALGIMPAWGGIERLTGLVGRGRALALMTTGRILNAADAFALGLFDEVVPRERFADRWRELAAQIACAPRDALVGIKAAQRAAYPTARPDLAAGAIASFARTWVADDHWRMVEEADARRRAARDRA
ncbi:MAG TPA: enoyl-CoA hydratase/isomerase family protein [Acidimicrobiia bacterium]|nr:enoyl-CoA hydratase/isomerase family protein [Acidimicrobiia bacterium]